MRRPLWRLTYLTFIVLVIAGVGCAVLAGVHLDPYYVVAAAFGLIVGMGGVLVLRKITPIEDDYPGV